VDTPSVDTPSVDTPSVDTPSVDTPSVDTPSAARCPDPAHLERLREALDHRSAAAPARDPAWQQPSRQRERQIRAAAVDLAERSQREGVPALVVANLLDVPDRTLRQWRHGQHRGRLEARALGRPHARCPAEHGSAVVGFLHGHGPWIGVPTLQAQFPEVARAELRDLLSLYRYLWDEHQPCWRCALHWQVVGAVWAVDFSKVRQPIDGCLPYVLAVRDLASGQQLTWRPVSGPTAAEARAELELLFLLHGAPLVLKSANGSAFLAALWRALLCSWQVWPLY
jgi:hypothetical protein